MLVAVLALDQLTKRLVAHSIAPGERIAVLPGIHLVHTRNHGVAFGLEAGSQTLVAILVGLALLGLLVYFATHSSRPLIWLATGLLLGGALGNLLDRIRTGPSSTSSNCRSAGRPSTSPTPRSCSASCCCCSSIEPPREDPR